ncbi:hypothetical protein H8B01_36915 [Bradyrhizobium sp. Cham227]|nr:hypothetical protein [Bradyrhizobium brasilense]
MPFSSARAASLGNTSKAATAAAPNRKTKLVLDIDFLPFIADPPTLHGLPSRSERMVWPRANAKMSKTTTAALCEIAYFSARVSYREACAFNATTSCAPAFPQ